MSTKPQQRQPILAIELAKELGHHKLTVGLLLLCSVTAMAVVEVTHLSRDQVRQQDKLLQARDTLNTEWHYLMVEQGVLAEHSKIEKQATDKLQMYRPNVKDEVVVSLQ